MGRQIIKQPDGKFCIFSSIIDNVTDYDLTEDEIIEVYVDDFRESITEEVKRTVKRLNNGESRNFTFDEMLNEIKEIHSEKEMLEIKNIIENK